MKSLRKIIHVNLQKLSIAMMILILLLFSLLQIVFAQRQARANAQATFLQIEQILTENEVELTQIEAAYRETCLLNAESIAYIIQFHPEIIGNLQEFRELAAMLQVDEIHIFDNTGRIFTGTHPEYYNYTFETGEQIGFFKPMLYDKSLKLCQDITPNTAESKLVQYSALWSKDGQFIVQVGMYPDAVQKATEKNELSYIFSLLRGSPGVDLYAIDRTTGTIMGSTAGSFNDWQMTSIGLSMEQMDSYRKGAHVTIAGVDSYCVFTSINDVLIGYVTSNDLLYKDIPAYTLILLLCLLLIAAAFVLIMWRLTRRYVITEINRTNEKLRAISSGNLDERVDIQSSAEFSELSSHINEMIKSLLSSTEKINLVLNRTRLRIGVYEYNTQMRTVRFTQHVPKILDLDGGELSRMSSDYQLLQQYINRLREDPVPGEEHVYHFADKQDAYIKLEEITNGSDVLGVIMDVTQDFATRKQIEAERDIDPLTGLYNRRGLERQLALIFEDPGDDHNGALVMIDLDGLKDINDTYGHTVGDQYIKYLGNILREFGAEHQIAARMGGDEFVLLLYGYEDDDAVFRELERLRHIQKNTTLTHKDGAVKQVRFSFGYVLTRGRMDHEAMLAEADRHMYVVKRKHKVSLKGESDTK